MTVQEKQAILNRTGPGRLPRRLAQGTLALGVASVLCLGACHIHMASSASTPSGSRTPAPAEVSSAGLTPQVTRLSPPDTAGNAASAPLGESAPSVVTSEKDPLDEELAPSPLRRPYHDLQRHTFRSIGEDTDIDVSPDGNSVAYSSTQDSDYPKIYVKEHDSALVRAVTTGRFRDIHPKFSPDGDWIAFASNREGSFDIWLTSLGKSTVSEQITYGSNDDVHPTFSPDGNLVQVERVYDASHRETYDRAVKFGMGHRHNEEALEGGDRILWIPKLYLRFISHALVTDLFNEFIHRSREFEMKPKAVASAKP